MMMSCHYHYALHTEPSTHFWKHYKSLSHCHMHYVSVKANEERLEVDDWHKRERREAI